MLVQYTPLSALSEAELQRLKTLAMQMVLEGRAYIDFNGKYISCTELNEMKKTWKQNKSGAQELFG